ncbi:hypothetical protein ACFL4T_07430 [candidate division KSB1 bacterium]
MRVLKTAVLFLIFAIISSQSMGQKTSEIPIKLLKLTDRTVFINAGETDVIPNILAFSTEKGLIVINSGALTDITIRAKKLIEKDFGKKDFAFVINTGSSLGYTKGNHLFDNACIIGHTNGKSNMERIFKSLNDMKKDPQKLDNQVNNLNTMTNKMLEGVKKGSSWENMIKENLNYENQFFNELKSSDFQFKFPDITFDERLCLYTGNFTINLINSGVTKKKDDILIYMPELKLLHVGEIFTKNRLPQITESSDIPKWLSIFQQFLEKENEIGYVIGGHGEIMSMKDIRDNLEYINDLYEGIKSAKSSGSALEDVKEKFSFTNFNHMTHIDPNFPGMMVNMHDMNINSIWKILDK